jgi:hypothetical protein
MNFCVFNSIDELPSAGEFIKKHHYLKSISRYNKYVFVLTINNVIVGVATFGTPVGSKVKQSYGMNLIECKRFVLNNTPKNTGSWFMSKCIQHIKKLGEYEAIITYADPTQGHTGGLYRASNYHYMGVQQYRTPYVMHEGKKLYSRNLYDTHRHLIGKYKTQFAKPKHIYMYPLTIRY